MTLYQGDVTSWIAGGLLVLLPLGGGTALPMVPAVAAALGAHARSRSASSPRVPGSPPSPSGTDGLRPR